MSATVTLSTDSAEFARLTEPMRPELLALCYRVLGSVHDAEDVVQETLIRAWRSYGDFEGRSSLRTWLYRIATNACLRALENRGRRPLPSDLVDPATDSSAYRAAATERADIPWLEPVPDLMVSSVPGDPAAIVGSRASVRLALIAAVQYLPPRQRAVLILRDVLRWQAAEVADLLGTTTTAVNSMLRRARAQLGEASPTLDDVREPDDPRQREYVDLYAEAFQNADVATLVRLLSEDAIGEMPPQLAWFAGRDRIGQFLAAEVLHRPGEFDMFPVAANGQPAFAVYQNGIAHGIQVLTVERGGIARIVCFNQPNLVPLWGLPSSIQ